VWALIDYGFKVVISPRFADIFRGNSLQSGLLTVVLDEQVVEQLFNDVEGDPTTEVTVDLVDRQVRWDEQVYAFELDDYVRWRLLEGLDDIGLTLRHSDAIAEYEAARQAWLPAIS
jgi:3-isopropylmalate/(R)-2-methylmalate dehydratase small subunit